MSVARPLIDQENPWPGLEFFDEAAERYFNGRQQESAELRRLVAQAPLTALFGKSGLGKTSLVQAGLFPLLRKDHILPVYVRLDVRHRDAPLIDQVTKAFQAELQRWQVEAPAFTSAESLWHYLHRDDLELWSRQNQLLSPLFVFDQFEEVFTLGSENPDGIAGLRTDLADLIENRIPAGLAAEIEESEAAAHGLGLQVQRYKVLISFREDFLAAMEGWKRELPSVMRNRLRLLPMSGAQAFEAVHATAPHLVDAPLATQIVRFVAAAREEGATGAREPGGHLADLEVEPALLSLVCQGLNEKRKAQGKATFDAALLQGTGRAIILDYYRRALVDLPERVHRFIENELITEGGFRKPCAVDDARTVHGVTDRELRLLVDRRLLRLEPRQGTEWVELTHDLLSGVVRERRDERRAQERERERTRGRRRRRWVALIAGGSVALLAVGVTFGVLVLQARAQRQRAEAFESTLNAERTAQAAKEAAERTRQELAAAMKSTDAAEASRHVAEQLRDQAQQLRRQADAGRLAATLQQLAATGGAGSAPRSALLAIESIARSRAANVFQAPAAGQLIRDVLGRTGGWPLTAVSGRIASAAFSSDGRWLALANGKMVRLVDAARPDTPPIVIEGLPPITTLALAPDGRLLAVGSQAGDIRLWPTNDVASPPVLLRHGRNEVLTLAFDTKSRWLASGTSDGTVRLWDIARPRDETPPVVLGRLPQAFRIVAFSPDGAWLAAAGTSDPLVRIWNLQSMGSSTVPVVLRPERGVEDTILALAFSPDGRRVAVANSYSVQMWTAHAGGFAPTPVVLGRAGQWFLSVAFSPDGQRLAAGGIDSNVRLWNFTGAPGEAVPKPIVLRGHTSTVNAVRFSPSGLWLATASEDSTIRLWHVDDAGVAPITLRGHEAALMGVGFADGGRRLVSVGRDDRVRMWDVPDVHLDPIVLRGHSAAITGGAISPDSKWLATGSGDDTVRLWNLSAPAAAPKILKGHRPGLAELPVAFSPDGRWLAAVGGERTHLRLWDMTSDDPSGKALTLSAHTNSITDIRFSRNGRWLASGGWDGTIAVWSLGQAGPARSPTHKLSQGPVRALAFSADGRRLIAGDHQGTAIVWDMALAEPASRPLVLRHPSVVRAVAMSPDGRWAATGTWEPDNAVRLFDLAAPKPADAPVAMKFQNRVFDLAFSPDGRWLAAAAWDGGVQLLDVTSPSKKPVSLLGHQGRAFAVAFSADGEWLASSSEDHTVRLWKLGQAVPTAIVLRHDASVGPIAFSPDNRWLASASVDSTVRLWRMNLGDLIGVACKSAGRNLTRAEWRDYLSEGAYRKTCPDLPSTD